MAHFLLSKGYCLYLRILDTIITSSELFKIRLKNPQVDENVKKIKEAFQNCPQKNCLNKKVAKMRSIDLTLRDFSYLL